MNGPQRYADLFWPPKCGCGASAGLGFFRLTPSYSMRKGGCDESAK